MPKVGILGCEATTRDMDCVMIGCFGNMRGRQGMFDRYTEEDPPELVGIISCGGCPTAMGTERIWQKVKALKDYGIAPPGSHSCPQCDSEQTEDISEFGATACKALSRCLACREPFDRFKAL